jgi:hypothetical protein
MAGLGTASCGDPRKLVVTINAARQIDPPTRKTNVEVITGNVFLQLTSLAWMGLNPMSERITNSATAHTNGPQRGSVGPHIWKAIPAIAAVIGTNHGHLC